MHHRHAQDAVGALLQCRLDLRHLGTARLQPQEAGNGLQIILHPVVNFLDNCRLYLDFPFLFPQLRHIGQEHNPPLQDSCFFQLDISLHQHNIPDLDFPLIRPAAVDGLLVQHGTQLPV